MKIYNTQRLMSSSLCGWLIENRQDIGKMLVNFEITLPKFHYSISNIKKKHNVPSASSNGHSHACTSLQILPATFSPTSNSSQDIWKSENLRFK